jgi:AraC-like DNA-binding protein
LTGCSLTSTSSSSTTSSSISPPSFHDQTTCDHSHHSTLSSDQKYFIEGLIRRGKIGEATKRLKEIVQHPSIRFSPKTVAERLQVMHSHFENQFTDFAGVSPLSSSLTLSPLDIQEGREEEEETKIIESNEDFSNILNNLDPSSACGADGWSVGLLKKVVNDKPLCLT